MCSNPIPMVGEGEAGPSYQNEGLDDNSDAEDGGVGLNHHRFGGGAGESGSVAGGRVGETGESAAGSSNAATGAERAGGNEEPTHSIQSNANHNEDPGALNERAGEHAVHPPAESQRARSGFCSRGISHRLDLGLGDTDIEVFPCVKKLRSIPCFGKVSKFFKDHFRRNYSPVDDASERSEPAIKKVENCTSCMEKFLDTEILHSACGHRYCAGCVANFIRAAIKDESLFPPRCCGVPWDINSALRFLPVDLIAEFRFVAYERADRGRTYCSNPRCSRYLFPEVKGFCVICGSKTCIKCKQAAHEGACKVVDAWLADMAADMKWKTCFNCGRYVELHSGCNHVM